MSLTRRRYFETLAGVASVAMLTALRPYTAGAQSLSITTEAKPKSMEEWMDQWTGIKARDPVGGLYVYRFKDPMWVLVQPIGWKPNSATLGVKRVDVPKGFVTDFASIPRAFWSLLRPDGEYAYAAVIHDYLYWTQLRSKDESDDIFRLAMVDFKIDAATIWTIYQAVSNLGQSAWDGNKKLREKGERRVLARLPDDPRITWDEWRRDAGVFASQ